MGVNQPIKAVQVGTLVAANFAAGSVTTAALNASIVGSGIVGAGGSPLAIDTTVVATLAGTQTFTGSKTFSSEIMASGGITGLPSPVNPSDATSLAFVNSVVSGLDVKDSVAAATITTLPANTYNNGSSGVGATLTGNVNGTTGNIDGYTPLLNDRLLIMNEAAPAHNGIYVVTQVGVSGGGGSPYILTRSTDFNQSSGPGINILTGAFTFVENGTANGGTGWILVTTGTIIVGTTALTFTQFSSAANIVVNSGSGLTKTGNVLAVLPDNSTGIMLSVNGVGIIGGMNADIQQLGLATTGPLAGTPGKVAWASHVHPRDYYRQSQFTSITAAQNTTTNLVLAASPIQGVADTTTLGNKMLMLFLNGVLLEQGGTNLTSGDYYVVGSTITYLGGLALVSTDVFLANFYSLG